MHMHVMQRHVVHVHGHAHVHALVKDLAPPLLYLTNNQAGAQILQAARTLQRRSDPRDRRRGLRRKAGEEPANLNASAVGGARPNPSRAACS